MRIAVSYMPSLLNILVLMITKKLPLTCCYEIMNGDAKPLKRNHANVILTQKQQRFKR